MRKMCVNQAICWNLRSELSELGLSAVNHVSASRATALFTTTEFPRHAPASQRMRHEQFTKAFLLATQREVHLACMGCKAQRIQCEKGLKIHLNVKTLLNTRSGSFSHVFNRQGKAGGKFQFILGSVA